MYQRTFVARLRQWRKPTGTNAARHALQIAAPTATVHHRQPQVHYMHTVLDACRQHRILRRPFGATIGRIRLTGPILVDALVARLGHRLDAGEKHEALNACRPCRVDQIAGSFEIDAPMALGIRRRERMGITGTMKNRIHVRARLCQRKRIQQIAADRARHAAPGTRENAITGLNKASADETGRPRDQHRHQRLPRHERR